MAKEEKDSKLKLVHSKIINESNKANDEMERLKAELNFIIESIENNLASLDPVVIRKTK